MKDPYFTSSERAQILTIARVLHRHGELRVSTSIHPGVVQYEEFCLHQCPRRDAHFGAGRDIVKALRIELFIDYNNFIMLGPGRHAYMVPENRVPKGQLGHIVKLTNEDEGDRFWCYGRVTDIKGSQYARNSSYQIEPVTEIEGTT